VWMAKTGFINSRKSDEVLPHICDRIGPNNSQTIFRLPPQ
jgi:hypothetical protein